jgi:hypothetical protein
MGVGVRGGGEYLLSFIIKEIPSSVPSSNLKEKGEKINKKSTKLKETVSRDLRSFFRFL